MIQINCIGAGRWGPNLIRALTNHPEATVRTVCDLSKDRLITIKQRIPGIRNLTTNWREAVEDPEADAVAIATPVWTHAQIAEGALRAGKHVFVEKPLCDSSEEAERLVELARQQRRLLCVGFVFLFNNGIRAARNLIRTGGLGRIRYLHATRTNLGPIRTDVNAFWDLAAHDVCIFNYLIDEQPLDVTARGESYINAGIKDMVVAGFSYPNDIVAYVHASWLNPRKVRELTIVGEQKMVVWDDLQPDSPIQIFDRSVAVEKAPVYSDSFGSFQTLIRHGEVVIPHIPGDEPLISECSHFIDCIQGRQEPLNSAAATLGVIYALEAADRSLGSDSVRIPIDRFDRRGDSEAAKYESVGAVG